MEAEEQIERQLVHWLAQLEGATQLLPFLDMPDIEELRDDYVRRGWRIQRLVARIYGARMLRDETARDEEEVRLADEIDWFGEERGRLAESFKRYLQPKSNGQLK